MTRYLYLEAALKTRAKKRKLPRRRLTDDATEGSKKSNDCRTQGNPAITDGAEFAWSVDYSHQDFLLPLAPSSKKASSLVSSNQWYELQNKLFSRNLQRPIRTLMFSGTDHGIGVTTAVVNFSRALAETSNRKVLIIDINLRTPRLHSIFKLNPENGITELFLDNSVKTCAFKKVGEGLLSVITCGRNCSDGVNYLERERIGVLIKEALDKFDYVLLDSAPITKFADSQAICSLVDGALLVIQAGKTRQQQALRAKKELEEAGGKLLGVILNKRKYYIPEWIYRRL